MADDSLEQLSPDVRRSLEAVASEDLETIPDEFSGEARFVLGGIRVATRRADVDTMCAFVYSEAPSPETTRFGFDRIVHMQDGHGSIDGCIIATNQDANNGMCRSCKSCTPGEIMDELEELGFGDRCTVIWDPEARTATIYPTGVSESDNHIRNVINFSNEDLSQDEVCTALDNAYNENLKNPSTRTIKLWLGDELIHHAEDEIERHVKGQLTMFFIGRKRHIKILSQTNTDAGRADLIFLQKLTMTRGPCMIGVLELKVLRGPEPKNKKDTKEGLSQGFHYRNALGMSFAILALFDVAVPPSDNLEVLLDDQLSEHLDKVHVKRYPIYNSSRAWRDAGGPGKPKSRLK